MSKQEINRLRELSQQELLDERQEAKQELFNLKFQWMATRQLSNTARLRLLRQKVARINTLLRERELEGKEVNA